MRNHIEELHSEYREIFSQVEEEINSQLRGIPLESYSFVLKNRLARVIADYNKRVSLNRMDCKCIGCGVCCRFAVSEFSYDQLKQKAENGDDFALQFVSVFVPYDNESDYLEIFPEYIDLLKDSGKYYVYHCPRVSDDNRCTDYDNRPQICKDFPDNPVAFLPKSCGYSDWKLKSEQLCLRLRAEKEIINYLLNG